MKIPGWLWLVWVSIGVLVEGIAIGTAERGDTLTETIMATLPWWVVLVVVGWVTWHFGVRALAARRSLHPPLDDPDGGRRGD